MDDDNNKPKTEPRIVRDWRLFREGFAKLAAQWLAPVPIKASREPKGNIGRPQEHNWERAFLFARAYVATNGLPKVQQRMVELVRDWFKKNDGPKVPDDREIRRRVRKVFFGGK
jgi:hypothetical protein